MQLCEDARPKPRRELDRLELAAAVGADAESELQRARIVAAAENRRRPLEVGGGVVGVGHRQRGGVQCDDRGAGDAEDPLVAPPP